MPAEPVEDPSSEEIPARLRFEKLVKGEAVPPHKPIDPAAEPRGLNGPPAPPPAKPKPGFERLDARIAAARAGESGVDAGLSGPRPEVSEPSRVSQSSQPSSLPGDEVEDESDKVKKKGRSFWLELPILVLVALVVAIVIKTFFFQAFYIPSGSMQPTLEINDRVLVNKLSYQFGDIQRGDILVFDSPESVEVDRSFVETIFRAVGESTGLLSPDTVLIKRVIGLPGDEVEIRENQVYVNGEPTAETYLANGVNMPDMQPLDVPIDHVFLMGDNRNQSRDSRFFGPVHRDDVVGRAFVTVWPPGRWGGL